MTDFAVRLLDEVEYRSGFDLFRRSLLDVPVSDDHWEFNARLYENGRAFGAFADQHLIGTTMSFRSDLALPGGASVPMAAVSWVGVRADHRRRGVQTALMRAQLAGARTSGDVLAGLHASEPVIYGRYGYGISTVARTTRVRRQQAELRPEVPRGGEVRLLEPDLVIKVVPGAYERIFGHRPGMMTRGHGWWAKIERQLRSRRNLFVGVHTGADGDDGFVTYLPQENNSGGPVGGATLQVSDFHAGNQVAANELWRHLLGLDLVDEIVAYVRPLDEPIEAMLVDRRAVRAEFDDELWLRLVDVPAALAARTYGDAEPIVLEVRDPLLATNSGRYRVSPQGTEPTTAAAHLNLDVEALAMIYLGAWKPSVLAGIGRLEVADPSALRHADRLFATDVAACCGTMF